MTEYLFRPADTVMAFDFGTRKIGVAVGQGITRSASPAGTIRAKDGIPNWDDIARLIRTWEPAVLIVGLPLNMDGTESELSLRALKFARRLTGRFQLPHIVMDERLTSREARWITGSDGEIDDVAAALILESWFRQQPEARES
ncbi:MAG: Holliday junction resolvase RuvX [Pseudomonadales bacterium]|nr:Holliday junction resolvase RuvX [Pseudomonadales bacterium]